MNEVSANKISTAAITSTGAVSGKLDTGGAYTSQIPTALDDTALTPLLLDHKVQVTGTNPSTTSVLTVLEDLLPLLLIVGVLIWFVRRGRKQMGGGLGGIMGIGRSKAKVYDEEKPTTRFADIAGYEGSKAEVMEVVDFLKYPERYAAAGAVGSKGVLMNILTAADFDAARDRLLIGRRDASNALVPEEKHSVAVHEAGHALVAALSEHADPVAKVTILPRGAALGVTEQLPFPSAPPIFPELPDRLAGRPPGWAGR